jgi:hypothetical protein
MAVVVTRLYIRMEAHPNETVMHPIPRPFPLASGARDSVAIKSRLESVLARFGIAQFMRPTTPGVPLSRVKMLLAIRVDYTALETMHESGWFDFIGEAVAGKLLDLTSKG